MAGRRGVMLALGRARRSLGAAHGRGAQEPLAPQAQLQLAAAHNAQAKYRIVVMT